MSTNYIRVNSVVAGRKSLSWLNGFEFELDGNPILLYGQNGTGKSTILNALSKESKEGVSVDGYFPEFQDILSLDSSITGFFSFRTAYASLFSQSVRRRRNHSLDLEEVMKRLSILPNAGMLLSANTLTLSAGERKLIAIAIATTVQPNLLILDEPFAHIHIDFHKFVISWISEAAQHGVQVILSAHEAFSSDLPIRNIELPAAYSLEEASHIYSLAEISSEFPEILCAKAEEIEATQNFVVGSYPSYFGSRTWTKSISTPIQLLPGLPTLLVGNNGAGKSTILRTFGGLRSPVNGDVLVGGKRLYKRSNASFRHCFLARNAFGLVSDFAQNDVLLVHATIIQLNRKLGEALNVVFGRDDWVEAPWTLSSGQINILLVAGALASGLPYVNLDEPFSNLSRIVRNSVAKMMCTFVQTRNCSCLITDHGTDVDSFFENKMVLQ